MKTAFLTILFIIFLNQPAQALIEIRTHAGLEFNDPEKFNSWLSTQNIKQIYLLPRTGFQVFLTVIPAVGLGLVYDRQSIKVNSSNNSSTDAKLTIERYAFKGYYHLVDRGFFTGPTVSFGFKHKLTIDGTGASGGFLYDKADGRTFSASWEIGGHIKWFVLGGDLGFQSNEFTNIRGDSGDAPFDLNTSGFFFSGFVGVAF